MAGKSDSVSRSNLLLVVLCIGVVGWIYGKDMVVDRLGLDSGIFGQQASVEAPSKTEQPQPLASVTPALGIVVMDMEEYLNDPEVLRLKLTPDQVQTRAAEVARDYAARGYAVLLRSDTLAVPSNAIVPIFP